MPGSTCCSDKLPGWSRSTLIQVVNWALLLYATVAAGILFLTSLVGITGAIMNSRPMLAFYNALLWPSLGSTAIVGYSSYKRRAFNLEGKMAQGWSQSWGDVGRTIVQDTVSDVLHKIPPAFSVNAAND